MKKVRSTVVAAVMTCAAMASNADQISQTFDSSWSVGVWDYYGDVAALQWHYLPYKPWDSSLGTLTKVTVETSISGSRVDANDITAFRYSFFTGWAPNDYQFFAAPVASPGSQIFSLRESVTYNDQTGLADWLTYDYYPGQANYYFESRTALAAHDVVAQTILTYEFTTAVPEPESYALMLAGLGVLGCMARCRKFS